MKRKIIQLVPGLIQLETNAKKINGFSFWNSKVAKDFFNVDSSSEFKFRYIVKKNIEECPEKVQFRFSNLSYVNNKWYYYSKKFFFKFKFTIDESTDTMTVNPTYHRHLIRIGFLETTGNILADYMTYKIEQNGKSFQDGAAAILNKKTFLIFGPGKNFKTTLLNMILESGGGYIGDEFFLLSGDNAYSIMPNISAIDFRSSHKDLLKQNLKKQTINFSKYDAVFFLVFSNENNISEITLVEANNYLKFYHRASNAYYYNFFKNRENLVAPKQSENVLENENAKYFLCYFTDINNIFNFIKNYECRK
jgi:hypothetical protein